jgi:hypothetical protein
MKKLISVLLLTVMSSAFAQTVEITNNIVKATIYSANSVSVKDFTARRDEVMSVIKLNVTVEGLVSCVNPINKAPMLKETREGLIELFHECETDQELVMSGWITPSRPTKMDIILRHDGYASPKKDSNGEILREASGAPIYEEVISKTYALKLGNEGRAQKTAKVQVDFNRLTKKFTLSIK